MNPLDRYFQARKPSRPKNKDSEARSVPAPILAANTASPRPQRKSFSIEPVLWAQDSKEGFVLVKVIKSGAHACTGQLVIDGKKTGPTQVYDVSCLFNRSSFPRTEITDCCALQNANAANAWAHLRARYAEKMIYTNICNILIAMNPFCQIEDLYSEATLQSYLKEYPKNNEPHVFRLAADALKNLKTSNARNIIITGQSGAGKTRSAQHVMKVICSLQMCIDSMDEKILNANIILEAFGNAATRLNCNSSRYNKLVQVQYNGAGCTLGGHISQHLLETTRVTSKNNNEGNFHIFHIICAGLRGKCGIEGSETFKCLATELPARCDKEDGKKFDLISKIGVTDQVKDEIFSTMSAILNLSNVVIVDDPCDHSASVVEVESKKFVDIAARQLGMDSEQLNGALIADTIKTGRENIRRNLNTFMAIKSRDALAQGLYSAVFEYIIGQINHTIKADTFDKSIYLLDLAGFENFYEGNDVEQLCINYCNEKMFNFFTHSIITSEKALLEEEGLQVPNINYECNDRLIETFEGDNGIFTMITDFTKMGTAKIDHVTNTIHSKYSKNPGILRPSKATYKSKSRPRDEEGFVVKHFAEPVCYQTVTIQCVIPFHPIANIIEVFFLLSYFFVSFLLLLCLLKMLNPTT